MGTARYSTKPFPPYRFIPGRNPHPTENPQGHSYGKPEDTVEPLSLDHWSQNETYLHGIDLYNHQYWWEAHEAWESLWKRDSKNALTKEFLQGLIKTSAAFIKWESKTPRGIKLHYQAAIAHFKNVVEKYPVYMGIDLRAHIDRLTQCFESVLNVPASGLWPKSSKNYPVIQLQKN